MAMMGGIGFGYIITTAFIVSSTWAYYTILSVSVIVLGLLTYFLQNILVIFMTSFIGSYFIFRGIAFLVGNNSFPNEATLHEKLIQCNGLSKRKQEDLECYTWDTFPKEYYAYMSAILVLTVIACLIQSNQAKIQKDLDKKEAEEEKAAIALLQSRGIKVNHNLQKDGNGKITNRIDVDKNEMI